MKSSGRTFCREIERPELEKHPDYATNAARIRNRGVLEPLLEDVFRQRAAAEWIGRLQGAGIPASLVRNFQEVVEHPQCDVRQMFPTLQHPVAGPHRVTGTPVKLSETPGGTGSGRATTRRAHGRRARRTPRTGCHCP